MAMSSHHRNAGLPSWTRPQFGRAPQRTLDPIALRSDGAGAAVPTTPPKAPVTIQFLQDQHRAVLGALAGELDKLKVENRDLKFRLVMRDTATPKANKRVPAASDIMAMQTELSELRQKNAAMERERSEARSAAAAPAAPTAPAAKTATTDAAQGLGNELEINRVNKMNFDLLSEVAALRHELTVQSARADNAVGGRRHSGSHTKSSSSSGGGDRLAQSLPPMGMASFNANGGGGGNGGGGNGGVGSASRQPGLKDYGILKTGANNQPRILNRRRASGDQNGRTRRKLVPVPQPATLKPLNVGESFGSGFNNSHSSTGNSSTGRRK